MYPTDVSNRCFVSNCVGERERKRAEGNENRTRRGRKKTGAASVRSLQRRFICDRLKSVAAGDTVMTGAGTGMAGADHTVAAADLAAQRMGYPVAGSTGVASDDITIVPHFAAHGIPALLGLRQWAERQQYGYDA